MSKDQQIENHDSQAAADAQGPQGAESAERSAEPMGLSGIAQQLRDARTKTGRSLESFAADLRIRQRYLEALEDGRADGLPAAAFTAGFIRSYGNALGLGGNAMAAEYRRRCEQEASRPALSFPEPIAESRLPGRAALVSAIAGLALVYFGWVHDFSGLRTAAEQVEPVPERLAALADGGEAARATDAVEPASFRTAAEAPEPSTSVITAEDDTEMTAAEAGQATTAPPPAQKAAADGETMATAAAAPPSQPPAAAVEKRPQTVAEAKPRVTVKAMTDAWLYVVDSDNREVWNGVLRAGESWSPKRRGLKLMTSNAGGLDIAVDGRRVEPLGAQGAVVRNVSLDADALNARGTMAMR